MKHLKLILAAIAALALTACASSHNDPQRTEGPMGGYSTYPHQTGSATGVDP
jgi:outer membrane biogenesis lipoprotein LolB